MIFLDSRYVDGPLFKAYDSRKSNYNLTVFRQWPTYVSEFFWYEWVESDRLDVLATRFLGDPSRWWEIMDVNPEINNPFTLEPGQQIRIPNA